MLTRDVRLEGFDTTDWVRLADVVRPRRDRVRDRGEAREPARAVRAAISDLDATTEAPARAQSGIIAVTTGNRLRKLLSLRQGRLPVVNEPWPDSLQALAARHGARWAIELHTGALDELMDRLGQRLHREQDFLAQMALFLGILRELESEGVLSAWPWRLSQWPVPNERMRARALDALCPEGRSLLVGVFERGELATCLAARRRGGGFDYLLGPEDLRSEMGLISGDWTRDYRHLVRVVEERLGPLAVGCFGEYDTFQELAGDNRPGAWAAAVAGRDIIVSPIAPALAIPLGVDVGRAAVATVRELAERMGASSWLGPDGPLSGALERVERMPFFDRDLRRWLGFDPILVLRKLLARDPNDD